MSNYGFILIASGISEMGAMNQQNEILTCSQAVNDTSAYCSLTTSWSTQLNNDENQCFIDEMSVGPSNPWKAAAAAEDHAKFMADASSMNRETDSLNTQIQQLEAQLQQEGNAMETVFNSESPINSVEGNITQLLTHAF